MKGLRGRFFSLMRNKFRTRTEYSSPLPHAGEGRSEGKSTVAPPSSRVLSVRRDCVAIPKPSCRSASLSFRPEGEILDPSHPFGMTTRSSAFATQ